MDQVACPRCMAVAPSGTPRCPVCSASLERGVRVEPQAVPVRETGWAIAEVPAPTEVPLPIEAFAPPPPGSPGLPLQWTPTPAAAASEPAPATWSAPPSPPPPPMQWTPPADPITPGAAAPTAASAIVRQHAPQGGQGWNVRVREEVHHLAHPQRAAPAQMAAVAGAGGIPMYGATAAPAPWAAPPPLPPAPWERRTAAPARSGWMAGLGALVLARIIGITVAAAVGVLAFGHHNWLSNLAHGGTHDVTTPAFVGASPKVLSGPLASTAADITGRAGGAQGVNNAVASYYGAPDAVPDYFLYIVSGNTQNLTQTDVINSLKTGGLAVDIGPTATKTVNGIDYGCSSYTLTVSNTSVAGRICVWVTYNDAGALASYRDMDPDQMLSITDAARKAANA